MFKSNALKKSKRAYLLEKGLSCEEKKFISRYHGESYPIPPKQKPILFEGRERNRTA